MFWRYGDMLCVNSVVVLQWQIIIKLVGEAIDTERREMTLGLGWVTKRSVGGRSGAARGVVGRNVRLRLISILIVRL
jgi:hypothetical protein